MEEDLVTAGNIAKTAEEGCTSTAVGSASAIAVATVVVVATAIAAGVFVSLS